MKHFAALFLGLVLAGKILAADVATEFSAANKLYSEGNFVAAAAAYEGILRAGAASEALYFNDGDAEFKLGHLGRAIVAYRRAELLSPRDSDVRANLEFARKQVQGASRGEAGWQAWLGMLTLNEWTVLVAVAFWLAFILLATTQIRPAWRGRLRGVIFAVAATVLVCGAALGVQAENHFASPTAVIVAATATILSGPFDGAQRAFTERDGVELAILGRHDGWLQVEDAAGKSGWLEAAQAEVLPGA